MIFAAILGVALVYFDSLDLGLWWDDYLVLRPWSLAEVAQTFHGTWEPWDVLPVFYRPLTAAYQALAFQAFGLNTWALASKLPSLARAAGSLVLVVTLVATSRAALEPVRPCGPEQLQADADVRTWAGVPDELKAWLDEKAAACSRGEVLRLHDSIETVVWPLADWLEGDLGLPGRPGRRFVVGIDDEADSAGLEVRLAPGPAAPKTARIVMRVHGGASLTEAVRPDWQQSSVMLPDTLASRLRHLHWIDVRVDPADDEAAIELRVVHLRYQHGGVSTNEPRPRQPIPAARQSTAR